MQVYLSLEHLFLSLSLLLPPSPPPPPTSIDGGLVDVLNGRGLHYVADLELLNGLVLGHTAATVGTSDRLGVAPAVFGPPVVTSL